MGRKRTITKPTTAPRDLAKACPLAAKLIPFAKDFVAQRRESIRHALNERYNKVSGIEARLLAAIAKGERASLTPDEEAFLSNPIRGL